MALVVNMFPLNGTWVDVDNTHGAYEFANGRGLAFFVFENSAYGVVLNMTKSSGHQYQYTFFAKDYDDLVDQLFDFEMEEDDFDDFNDPFLDGLLWS